MTTPQLDRQEAGPVFGRHVTSVRAPRGALLRKLARVVTSSATEPVEVAHGSDRAVLPPELVEMLGAALRALESGEQLTLVVVPPSCCDSTKAVTSSRDALQ